MTDLRRPESRAIAALFASSAEGAPRAVDEELDSLELASLLHQVELQYGVELDLGDDQLEQMSTLSHAANLLADVIAGTRDV